jgi:UbiD family decarboxylase
MRDFIKKLKAQGELLEVTREVQAKHQLAAITDQVQKKFDKPVVFNKVTGTRFPVVTSIYSNRARLAQVLGIAPTDFCRKWHQLTTLSSALAEPPIREVAAARDLEDVKVSELPLITYSERDAGPYFTSAIFLAEEPETKVRNLSFHRSMYVSDQELRVRLAPRHHLTLYHEKAEKMGRPLEAAMLIGPPPQLFLTAAAPLPYDADEVEVAAHLRGEPIEMRPCKHINLRVPASTEIVIEGRFLPNERRPEGPFGEFMGYYVPVDNNAVFEVLGVTARPGAVFHSILCGSPEEVLTLEITIAANIFQRISAVLPGILDVVCLPFAFHAVVKIRQQYEGHARQVLTAVLGAEPTWAKYVTVVDEDVDIYDFNDVFWAILTRARPDKDTIIVPDTPTFYRDPHKDHWGRMAIDACVPFARRSDFERKRLVGVEGLNLDEWIAKA